MSTIKEILMTRDGMTPDAADELISLAKSDLDGYLADGDIYQAGEVCMEYFGLEPDYLMDLIYHI